MNQVIKIFFRYRARYYSSFINIVHEFETDFIYIEFLDEDMIEALHTSCFSYIGQQGYKNLPIYQSNYLSPIFNRIGNIIENAQRISNNQRLKNIQHEEYIRQN